MSKQYGEEIQLQKLRLEIYRRASKVSPTHYKEKIDETKRTIQILKGGSHGDRK